MDKAPKKKRRHKRFEVLPGEGRRFSFSRLRQALFFYILLFVALAIIIQLGYHWLGGQFLAWRLQVVAAEPGVMQQEVSVEGLVTRHEEVIAAPANGFILQLAPAGERVPAGSEIMKLGVVSREELQLLQGDEENEPDEDRLNQLVNYWQQIISRVSDNEEEEDEWADTEIQEQAGANVKEISYNEVLIIYNGNPGYLSYYIDGWEGYNGPYYLTDENDETAWEGSAVAEGDLVEAGQPLIKIVNNWHWYFNLILPPHPGYKLGDFPTVEIEFDFAPGDPVTAKLNNYEVDETTNNAHLTYIIEKQLYGFDRVRRVEATLRFKRQQGIIVPAEALLEKDHHTGVYLNKGGRVVFHPVTVVERQEEKVMVEGLSPYSLVISRPELVQEGQRLN
jgi:putative membrane fusion protein